MSTYHTKRQTTCRPRTPSVVLLAALWVGLVAFGMSIPSTAQAARGGFGEAVYSSRSVLNLRVSIFSGIPDLAGASVTLTALRPFAVEAGASTFGLGATAFGKLGAAIPLVNTRNAFGRGVTLDLMLMGGYRYLYGSLFGTAEGHAVIATLGLDFTWWLAPHFGLTANLNGGGGFWLSHSNSSEIGFPEGRLSIGVAF